MDKSTPMDLTHPPEGSNGLGARRRSDNIKWTRGLRCSRFSIFLIVLASLFQAAIGTDLIRVVVLRDDRDAYQNTFLQKVTNTFNRDTSLLPQTALSSKLLDISPNNSFRTGLSVCSSLKTSGVAAIFGPQSSQTSAHVQSICDALEIPYIDVENHWDFPHTETVFSVNLYPHPSSLSRAYADVLKALGWKKFCIIYENNNGLIYVQELIKDKSFDIMLKQLPSSTDYRPMLKAVKKSGVTHMLLDVQQQNLLTILKQAQQMGMMTSYYNYFVTSLDLQTVELEDFRHAGTKITGLRIVDLENPRVQRISQRILDSHSTDHMQTKVALIYDGFLLLAKALTDLMQSQRINLSPLDCERNNTWTYGSALLNYLRYVQVDGLTGPVKFDSEGIRNDVTLDIVDLTEEDGLIKVGNWDISSGANLTRMNKVVQQGTVEERLQTQNLVVTSILVQPYIMLKENAESMTGNDRYEGFCIDLIKEISKILGFNYTIKLVADESYGRYDEEKHSWNGMIGELIEGKADLVIADITINQERQKAVDFSMPWMNLGISLLYKKPIQTAPSLFIFLFPLSLDVWLCWATAFLAVSLLIYALARLSPYENRLSLLNSFWYAMGSLFRQGNDQQPKATSTRIVVGIWWFFTLIMVSIYTANLVAFFVVGATLERARSPIESVDDLSRQSKVKYGTLAGGSTYAFFRDSNIPTYNKMFRFMESQRPSVFTKSYKEGLDKVLESNGNYAFMMESSTIEYITERYCSLIQVGGLLDSKSYGIALPAGSPYTDAISGAILKLHEDGILNRLKLRWWKERRGGGKCRMPEDTSSSPTVMELGLRNVGGIFYILMAGMGLASLVAVVEFIWKSKRKTTNDDQS